MKPRELGFRVCRAFSEGNLAEGERLSRQFVIATTPDHRRRIMRQWVSVHRKQFPDYCAALSTRLRPKAEPHPPTTESWGQRFVE